MKFVLLCIVSLLFLATPLRAETVEPPLGLDPFPLSTVVSQLQRSEPDYRLMLGGIVKINGLVRSDREQRLQAQLTQFTWQLPSGYTPEAGFNYLRAQLLDKGSQVLFECAGRQCGPSSLWANDIFGQSRLYGVDSSQFYAAFSMQRAHVALYAVRRGNGRVYLHLDVLENDSLTTRELSVRLSRQGYVELPDWPDSPDRTVQALLDLSRAFPEHELWLVVHWQGQDLELTLRQSQEAAERLQRMVIDEGADGRYIRAKGVGGLVPSVLGARRQVAVVVLKEG
ncbi:MAG: DUF4892 domain-containing protein [Oceanospirillales bacterium]|uniref:Uncharacterized protein DUF4892 n=1 Tax=Marinobacterium halophilum TaxID=267374 RepID=A0A2P8EZK0_9GAMM|nr:DUF4892 domain-containing protein [Marinobacterium halophilum]MBR9828562.1 DUF4892 domain-containing protein [Oceanospirillales bacterium]PSL14880.1 uncharacterized protein DUF4892 [Marinobacterium halophilum]